VNSWVYRLEYGVAFFAILWILFQRPGGIATDFPVTAIALTLFWFAWPDLGAFVPIGVATRKGRPWPSWGPGLYNGLHTFLTWAVVFVPWTLASNSIPWPLLGWPLHIVLDRATGFTLRAPVAALP
jgi:hypothetical protein